MFETKNWLMGIVLGALVVLNCIQYKLGLEAALSWQGARTRQAIEEEDYLRAIRKSDEAIAGLKARIESMENNKEDSEGGVYIRKCDLDQMNLDLKASAVAWGHITAIQWRDLEKELSDSVWFPKGAVINFKFSPDNRVPLVNTKPLTDELPPK